MPKMTSKTVPVKKQILEKKYRMYYAVQWDHDGGSPRKHVLEAENDETAKSCAKAFLTKLGDSYNQDSLPNNFDLAPMPEIFLTGLEEIREVKMVCPYCNGGKRVQVTRASQTGKYTRIEDCPGCKGSGELSVSDSS